MLKMKKEEIKMQIGKVSNNLVKKLKNNRESERRQKGLLYEKQQNTGITLIALVVTLIVLLILAGITIYAVFSPNRNYYQCT